MGVRPAMLNVAPWLLVAVAIAAEVSAAALLRHSDGFTRALPAAGAVTTFALAFYCISQALLSLPVSTVYPVWAGGGTAGAALFGMLLLGERRHPCKLVGVAAIVGGIVVLNLSAGAPA